MYWANLKHNLSLTPENIKNFQPADYKDCERVGVFNDGYLGNATDLGTFENRESEISWLNKQATTTFYGGEVVKDRTGTDGEAVGEYNNINYIEKEGFLTHTTYLNSRWNPDVINEWKETNYIGKNSVYSNNTSAYTYVLNHLGYRFLLTDSKHSLQTKGGGTFDLKIKIANLGFGNIINKKTASLILASNTKTYIVEIPIDFTKLYSKTQIEANLT